MSTRSWVGKAERNGEYKFIYCHCDGYLEGVGKMLQDYYNTPEKVNALLAIGNVSSIRQTLKETAEFSFGEEAFFSREEDFPHSGVEYIYVYTDEGIWKVYKVNIDEWYYVPLLLDPSWRKHPSSAKDEELLGDTYGQMREAEREGKLCELLFPILDNLLEEDYQAFRQKWSKAWSSYKKKGGEAK